jgi:hypothetical protein
MTDMKISRWQFEKEIIELRVKALHEAVTLDPNLMPALVLPAPPDMDDEQKMHSPATADWANQQAEAVERATVARVLRIASQFADWFGCGKSEDEIDAEVLHQRLYEIGNPEE